MPEQLHVVYGRFWPPIEVQGKLCSFFARFIPANALQGIGGEEIGSFQLKTSQAYGDLWQLVFERAAQTSSYTVVLGAGNSYEQTYDCQCGGSACSTTEYERILSPFSARAFRGPDMGDRLTPGVVLVSQRGWVQLVVQAAAFSIPPDAVCWHANADQRGPAYVEVSLYDLGTDPNGAKALLFDNTVTGLWAGTGVFWQLGAAYGEMTRHTFELEGTPDPYWYPPDAALDADAYWWDPLTGRIYLSSSFRTVGDVAQCRFFLYGDLSYSGVPSYAHVVVESSDATGLGDYEDSIAGAGFDVQEDFDVCFVVESGPAHVAWRRETAADSAMIEVSWDATGNIVSSSKREAKAGLRVALTTNTAARTFPFEVRIKKVSDRFYCYSRPTVGSGGWTPHWVSGETMADVQQGTDGVVGILGPASTYVDEVPTAGVRFYSPIYQALGDMTPDRDYNLLVYDCNARLGRMDYSTATEPDVTFDIAVASGDTVAEVWNVTSGGAMTESSDLERGKYRVVAGSPALLRFNAEANADEIRVSWAPGPTPTGTGRPPRVFNQTNAATELPGDPTQSTTNVSQNRLNWHDSVLCTFEAGQLPPAAGEYVSARRYFVWDPRDPPTFFYCARAVSEDSWTELPAEAFVAFYAEGLVLLTEEFRKSLGEPDDICLKAAGRRGKAGGGFDAEIANELSAVIGAADQLWTQVNLAGRVGRDMSGVCGSFDIYAGGWSCANVGGAYGWVPSYICWGSNGVGTREACNILQAAGKTWPAWHVVEGHVYQWDTIKRTWNPGAGSVSFCPAAPDQPRDDDDYGISGEAQIIVYPWHIEAAAPLMPWWGYENFRVVGMHPSADLIAPMDNYFGASPGGTSEQVTTPYSLFGIQAVPLDVPGLLSRLPAGSEIVSAKLRAKFLGYRSISWSGNGWISPDHQTYGHEYSEQGTLVSSYSKTPTSEEAYSIAPLYPEPSRSGSVTFHLFGRVADSRSIELLDGSMWWVPADRFYSVGGGTVQVTVTDGEWAILDVTGALNALLDRLDSQLVDFFWFPSPGGLSPDSDAGDMAGVLKGLLPSMAVALDVDGLEWGYTFSASGSFHWFSSLEIGDLEIQYRVGGASVVLPLIVPAAIPS